MRVYLTVGEVASLLGKCEKWVYSNKEDIPGFFRLAKSIFFDKEVLMRELKFLAQKKVLKPPTPHSMNDVHGLTS